MTNKIFVRQMIKAVEEKRRLVVPLLGFPGLNLTGCSVKLAQQNYSEHSKVLKTIANTFAPDVLFPLMDLSVEANALGRYTVFPKEESATVPKEAFHLDELSLMDKINISCDTRLSGYVETIKLISINISSSILKGAYVTGPYTLAALLMGAEEAAIDTVLNQEELKNVCRFTTKKIHEYIRLLISAGAQIICILEPSAVMLGPEQFEQFSACFVKNICESYCYSNVSFVYHICGNTMHLIDKMAESGVDALSLDSLEAGVDLPNVAKRISSDIGIIGNINPVGTISKGSPGEVENETIRLLRGMETFKNFVLSTGCDLPQETPLENIRAFIRAGRNYKTN